MLRENLIFSQLIKNRFSITKIKKGRHYAGLVPIYFEHSLQLLNRTLHFSILIIIAL